MDLQIVEKTNKKDPWSDIFKDLPRWNPEQETTKNEEKKVESGKEKEHKEI